MNWDITIGRCKQYYGRYLQWLGERIEKRKMVLDGELTEYAGRLQIRYGTLKHQALWNLAPSRAQGEPARQNELVSVKESTSA